MKNNTLKLITLLLALVVSLPATVLKQQSFEGAPTDTWGYIETPSTYSTLSWPNNYAVWGRDKDLPNNVTPVPDGDYVWNAENTELLQPGINHTLTFSHSFETPTSNISLSFDYFTFVYPKSNESWSGENDILNYYIEYNDDMDWSDPIPLNMGTNEWVHITIDDIPDPITSIRLRFEVINNTNSEVAAFDLITLETTDSATPITLSDFSAKALSSGIEVSWTTASEKENSGFKLYRDDEVIAFIEGAGTTTETNDYSYLDKNVVPGKSYTYTLADLSYDNTEKRHDDNAVTIVANSNTVDNAAFVLEAAYPNPFNPSTSIDYTLTETQNIDLSIFNMKGEKVVTLFDGERTAGHYSQTWNATNVQTGVYLLRAKYGNQITTQKLLLIK